MLNFPEPPKSYSSVFLEETDKSLPEKIDPRTRYAFFSTIAQGGKSLIKSCKDLHLSRFVCYKTLKPEFAADEIEQKRLIREARVTAMLQHPNTVPTYELGRDGRGNPYFTMKLVHGFRSGMRCNMLIRTVWLTETSSLKTFWRGRMARFCCWIGGWPKSGTLTATLRALALQSSQRMKANRRSRVIAARHRLSKTSRLPGTGKLRGLCIICRPSN